MNIQDLLPFPVSRVLVGISGSISAAIMPSALLLMRQQLEIDEIRVLVTEHASCMVSKRALHAITGFFPTDVGASPMAVPHADWRHRHKQFQSCLQLRTDWRRAPMVSATICCPRSSLRQTAQLCLSRQCLASCGTKRRSNAMLHVWKMTGTMSFLLQMDSQCRAAKLELVQWRTSLQLCFN